MTDDSKYIISPQDLHNIIYMTPGAYPVQDVTGGKRCYDLIIQEILLNRDLIQAIKMTNEIVHTVNQWVANPKRGGNVVSKLVRKKSDAQVFFNDVRSNGRLVEVFAVLKQATLAVTHKLGGRKVTHIEQRKDMMNLSCFTAAKRDLKQSLDRVKTQISIAEQSRTEIGLDQDLPNEPIVKCVYPEGPNTRDGDVWSGYKAWCQEHNGSMHVDAVRTSVGAVRWLTNELIELRLDHRSSKIFVTPLKPCPEGQRDDEVQIGDIAVLLGQYVAIAEASNSNSPYGLHIALSMTNYLRIVSMEDQNQSRRGKSRLQESDARVISCLK